jgi:hypothetical protein
MLLTMETFHILVANELRYYREVLANAVLMLRPDIDVRTVEPELLDHELIQLNPDLVVCSRVTPTIRTRCSAWVELYPDGEPVAVVCTDGQSSIVHDIELDGLLSIIDRAVQARIASAIRHASCDDLVEAKWLEQRPW